MVAIRRALRIFPPYRWAASWYRRNVTYGDYQRWIRATEAQVAAFTGDRRPLISIVVPTYKYQARYLSELIDSVVAQSYDSWELCVVNACDGENDRNNISAALKGDPRIREILLDRNLHIAGNTNAGIAAANGEYIGLLDADDTLAPFALAEVATRLQGEGPYPDVLYSDEDKLSDDGKNRTYPFFKPDINEEMLLTSNYVSHFLVVNASLLKSLKIREGYNGAQDYDLVLRLYAQRAKFCHIPRVSYHWRLAEGSTAVAPGQKNYASEAGLKALRDYLKKSGIAANVKVMDGQDTAYEVSYVQDPEAKVLLIADESDQAEIARTTRYSNYSFGTDAKSAESDIVVFIAKGCRPLREDWLNELASKAKQPEVGLVGARVDMADGNYCRGYMADSLGEPRALISPVPEVKFGLDGLNTWPRTVLLPPTAVIAVRTKLTQLSGYDGLDSLADVAATKGLRNVFWPASHLRNQLFTVQDIQTIKKPATLLDPLAHPSLSVGRSKVLLRK